MGDRDFFDRPAAALMLGWAAFSLAVGAGIPIWRDWPSREVPADAADIGALVAIATYRRRTTP